MNTVLKKTTYFNKIMYWILVFLWMGVIFYLSSKPRVVPEVDPILANIISIGGHIVFYAILYLLLNNALEKTFKLNRQFISLLTLLIVVIYGVSDEFHQSFVPGRDASVLDVGLDLLGGVIAMCKINNKNLDKQ